MCNTFYIVQRIEGMKLLSACGKMERKKVFNKQSLRFSNKIRYIQYKPFAEF